MLRQRRRLIAPLHAATKPAIATAMALLAAWCRAGLGRNDSDGKHSHIHSGCGAILNAKGSKRLTWRGLCGPPFRQASQVWAAVGPSRFRRIALTLPAPAG